MSIFNGRKILLSVATGVIAGSLLLVQNPTTAQAAPAMAGVSSSRALIASPIAEVGHRYHHRKYRHSRYRNNNGAAIAGVAALGIVAGVVAANAAPRYYEPVRYGYVQEPVYNNYATPVQYGYGGGYYEEEYYQAPRHHRQYRHAQPQYQYYDKEAAKQYWRGQKEAQKRAIKQGYYAQPAYQQPYYGRQQYNQPSISGHNSYDYAPGQHTSGYNSYYNNR